LGDHVKVDFLPRAWVMELLSSILYRLVDLTLTLDSVEEIRDLLFRKEGIRDTEGEPRLRMIIASRNLE